MKSVLCNTAIYNLKMLHFVSWYQQNNIHRMITVISSDYEK